jgi:hypothetical protein
MTPDYIGEISGRLARAIKRGVERGISRCEIDSSNHKYPGTNEYIVSYNGEDIVRAPTLLKAMDARDAILDIVIELKK